MSRQITITLPDASTKVVDAGTTPGEVAAQIGSRLAKAAVAAKVDGDWWDLGRPVDHDASVEIVVAASPEGREVLRHSTAHVMAEAVTHLFPGAKYTIGPAIADGFYYDFDLPDDRTFTADDLGKIEDEMRAIVRADQRFVRDEVTYDDALAVFRKVTLAAEVVLTRSLPRLIEGTAPRTPQSPGEGEYCGRRRPEDGRIDWTRPAREIHDLVRAVAPPFPGAFADFLGERWMISRTQLLTDQTMPARQAAWLHARAGQCFVTCTDGKLLRVLSARGTAANATLQSLISRLEDSPVALA